MITAGPERFLIKPRIYADKRGSEQIKVISSDDALIPKPLLELRKVSWLFLIRVYPRKSAA